jgi:hypothetical protein
MLTAGAGLGAAPMPASDMAIPISAAVNPIAKAMPNLSAAVMLHVTFKD